MLSLIGLCAGLMLAADPVPPVKPATAKDGLQQLNLVVGSWKATGYPEGTREERAKGYWIETLNANWKFSGQDATVVLDIQKGKYFTAGEFRYDVQKATVALKLTTVEKRDVTFTGSFSLGSQKETVLTLDRTEAGEDQRLVFTLLHHNRFLYSYWVKPSTAKNYTKKYQVGATKEGEPFAEVAKGNECIVSGGRGTIAVMHNGKTYYVCCSGCRDAFKETPEKFIAEFEKSKKK